MVRATRETLKGDPTLLVAVLLSGAWIWICSVAVFFSDGTLPFERYQLHPIFLAGGFLFGVGASINQGCSISTMNQLAKGHLSKLLTVMGWFIGWTIWTQILAQGFLTIQYEHVDALSLASTLTISLTALVCTAIFTIWFKPPILLMLGVLCIGLIASLLFVLVPEWQPSDLIRDLGNAVIHGEPMPSLLRIAIVMALLTGMWIAAAVNHDAQLRRPRMSSTMRFLIAGTLMGIGAGMALGGNDTQLLFGIPATSPGALSALLFMFIGIICEQLIYQRGGMFYRRT